MKDFNESKYFTGVFYADHVKFKFRSLLTSEFDVAISDLHSGDDDFFHDHYHFLLISDYPCNVKEMQSRFSSFGCFIIPIHNLKANFSYLFPDLDFAPDHPDVSLTSNFQINKYFDFPVKPRRANVKSTRTSS